MTDFRVVQGSPCNSLIAPYFQLLARESRATVNSIYRGQDAAHILHAHGKHTQAEVIRLHAAGVAGFGPANPVNETTHCLFNDGVAYRHLSVGHRLDWWQQGIDVNDDNVHRMIANARTHGWDLFQPYKSGSEFHHLNFRSRPHPRGSTRARIIIIRATLPRK